MRRASTMSPIGSPALVVSPVNFFLDFNEKLLCFDLGSECNDDFSTVVRPLFWEESKALSLQHYENASVFGRDDAMNWVRLIAIIVGAGVVSSLTDWFFAGDWIHRRYTYPEIWRQGE